MICFCMKLFSIKFTGENIYKLFSYSKQLNYFRVCRHEEVKHLKIIIKNSSKAQNNLLHFFMTTQPSFTSILFLTILFFLLSEATLGQNKIQSDYNKGAKKAPYGNSLQTFKQYNSYSFLKKDPPTKSGKKILEDFEIENTKFQFYSKERKIGEWSGIIKGKGKAALYLFIKNGKFLKNEDLQSNPKIIAKKLIGYVQLTSGKTPFYYTAPIPNVSEWSWKVVAVRINQLEYNPK